jgi:hypothetical protein
MQTSTADTTALRIDQATGESAQIPTIRLYL